MTNSKNSLKHRLMSVRFAMWELHLYLDTHCGDMQAAELLNRYTEKYEELLKEYQCKYGPISVKDGYGAKWLKSPFPWVNSGSDC